MSDASSEIARELAPTGKLRATINLGNPVLAQKNPGTGEARGVSVELARGLGSSALGRRAWSAAAPAIGRPPSRPARA